MPQQFADHATPLSGQTALVTGGARRVGAQIVRTLHAAGADVVIHCHHSVAEGKQLAAELERQRAGSTSVLAADLLDDGQLPLLIEATQDRFGGLHLLVNNASTFYPTPIGTISAAQWNDLIGTNLRAPLFLTQAAAPLLKRAHGSVLN